MIAILFVSNMFFVPYDIACICCSVSAMMIVSYYLLRFLGRITFKSDKLKLYGVNRTHWLLNYFRNLWRKSDIDIFSSFAFYFLLFSLSLLPDFG